MKEEGKVRYQFEIITDGACDISQSQIDEYGIKIVPFHITFVSEPSHSYLQGGDISTEQYYTRLVNNPKDFPNTSCPSPAFFMEKFEEAYKNNLPIICICISSTWSGSFNSALIAKEMMVNRYGPNPSIEIIDSRADCVLEGLIILETARMRELGYRFDQCVNILHKNYLGRIYFTVSDLTYLIHGGRVGKLVTYLGKVLPLNPIIVADNGTLSSSGVALQKKRAIKMIFKKIKDFFKNKLLRFEDFRFVVTNCYDDNELDSLQLQFQIEFGFLPEKTHIGMIISSHVGPETLGVSFLKKFDR